ncbi:MAG: hypothetical protein LQ338_004703 [Usnochroma carphineum]|nr:MAG: hypothetical protein LQ338_004703 [Usnochroma carphineum]
MARSTSPKAVIFDIGGVCVLSPLEAIATYENKNSIPSDWINFAISRSAPNGFWQRLERGEIKIDREFFRGFNADLRNENLWKEYHTSFRNSKKKLKDVANPTQLGDHVSLKAEAADSRPTDQDRGAQSSAEPNQKPSQSESKEQGEGRPSLSKLAKDTTIGDPVSIESEDVAQGAASDFSSVSKQSTSSSSPSPSEATSALKTLPPLPEIDGESLFWSMMAHSRNPDPYVFPALLRLEKLPLKDRPILAALSNTVIFPPDHPYSRLSDAPESDPRSHFDIFVSSAEVGLRKPDPEIYKLAVERLDKLDKEKGGSGVTAEDCVFLDDIGENLKTAKQMSMKTIRVHRGKTWRAVKELEQATGTELMDDKTRRSKL